MSCPATNITGFNKSKEDFIWFIKKATTNKKSDAHAELYHCLLKMFVDADTNKDGVVSKASFSNLIDMAASIPRMYGYAPVDSELYKTEQAKEQARQKMFDSMDLKSTGVITFDEWYKFSMCLYHVCVRLTSSMGWI
jgi:Ca2+-binding EF-hand superfamily protein